ncbi:lysosomal Pro-X carboxypeptidase-like isoform X3 [Physella acuta]|uniref:lysosomal Pro-X carboxypeptidase-like isoform X3 n=1 Tax=Physella acuta TaxID=109671 RepID=UPI0027DEA45D|nr:lysosomal Pro-X carboxypeptidase-like isoform X3 [Physella acuta]
MEFSLKYCFLICELVVIFTNVESLHFGHTVSSAKKLLPLQEPYTYRTYYYDQQLDHLGFATMQKFKQRYLLADQFWNRNNGPIFFYTGNEGDIDWFCNNTGFMWDIAADFKALLVFAEHRYYGESLPFGPETYQNVSNLNYLTSEQALADFVELINYLKTNLPGAANSSVVAFGGSYGGMLAAWLRIKYPNVVVGALAASAPIWQFTNMTPCNAFYDTTSATWLQASATCVDNIHQSYNTIDMIASSVGGYDFITSTFGLCTPLKSKYDLIPFVEFLNDMYVNFAMVNYPYPADFLAQLPAWPVKRCTEMVMPICSNGTNMFCNIPWDLQQVSDNCYSQFKVRPRENWVALEYWAKELKTATNIIFSNGLYDPWSSGGVMQTLSDSLIAIQIPEGGHHLDLRGKHPLDTRAVINARLEETNIIRNWLKLTPVQ